MRTAKYNPAFQDPEQRKNLFAGRHHDLAEVLRVIRENSTRSQNQHLLVLGSRGMGKTTLLLRAVDEIKADPALSGSWFAIAAPEEIYRVGTIGELWLEMVFSLSRVTGEARHERAYEALRTEHDSPGSVVDDRRLADAARGYLLDFADRQKRRLVLVVENLQILLGEQLRDADAWALRETLIGEPRIMFLGSAVSSFEEIAKPEAPLFEQFLVHTLEPLDTRGCLDLWQRLTGQDVPGRRMRAIEILTGGNPRLLAILGEFAGSLSLRELTGDLARLIDDHTDYLKMTTEALPALERKVFVTLAEIWDYASAAEVATQSRVELNTASAQLGRLVSRGAVTSRPRGRGKQYRVAERLYSIYHMMRRRGGAAARARAATEFMVAYYDSPELANHLQAIAEEAVRLAPDRRLEHLLVVAELLGNSSLAPALSNILTRLPKELVDCPDAPEQLTRLLSLPGTGAAGLSELGPPRRKVAIPRVVREAVARIPCYLAHASRRDVDRAEREVVDLARELGPEGTLPPPLRVELERYVTARSGSLDPSGSARETDADLAPGSVSALALQAAYLSDFVTAYLHDMRALVLMAARRSEEARLAYDEAVKWYSRFVRNRAPDEALKVFWSLAALTDGLNTLERLDEAKNAAFAAKEFAKTLGKNAPVLTLERLAGSLGRLAQRLNRARRQDEAVAAAQNGLDILRVLEKQGAPNTDVAIANSLALLSVLLLFGESQGSDDVLATYQETEERLGRLAETQPQAFHRGLAMGVLAATFGRRGEVDGEKKLAASRRAVETLRAALSGGWAEAPEWLAQALTELALNLNARGDREQAERDLTEAISLDSSFLSARFGRGFVVLAMGRSTDALADLAALASGEDKKEARTKMVTDLSIALAEKGEVRTTLETVRKSSMATQLEPLVVALAKLTGEDVSAPAEIEEIAADIMKQIQEGTEARSSRASTPATPTN